MDARDDLGTPTSPGPVTPVPSGPPPLTLGTKIFWALVILGFAAASYGAIKTFVDNQAAKSALEERGVETDASVTSVTEVSGRRIETYHKISVAWDPEGAERFASAELLDCSGNRYESESDVRIVYLSDDPETVRLAACRSEFNSNVLPGIIGVVLTTITVLAIWKTRRLWR